MTYQPNDLAAIAKQAAHSCHHALLACIHLELMVDITHERVSVKGIKAGLLQGVTMQFDQHNKEAVVRLAISTMAQREIEHGNA